MAILNVSGTTIDNRRFIESQSDRIYLMARQNGITAEQARYLLKRMALKKR